MSNRRDVALALKSEDVANGHDDEIEPLTLQEEAQIDRDELLQLELQMRENLIATLTYDGRYTDDESVVVEQIDRLIPELSYREWGELRQNCRPEGRGIYQKVAMARDYASKEYYEKGYCFLDDSTGPSYHPDRIYEKGGAEWLGHEEDWMANQEYAYRHAIRPFYPSLLSDADAEGNRSYL